MSSAKILIFNLTPFVKLLHEVCIKDYAESYSLVQHSPWHAQGTLRPEKGIGSVLF